MTAPGSRSAPTPDAARFAPRSPSKSGEVIYTTDPNGWEVLGIAGWAALPVDARRTVECLPGVYLTVVRAKDGTFTVLNRHGIPAHRLASVRSAPRVPIDPDGIR